VVMTRAPRAACAGRTPRRAAPAGQGR
jgi:hypothetical protein